MGDVIEMSNLSRGIIITVGSYSICQQFLASVDDEVTAT